MWFVNVVKHIWVCTPGKTEREGEKKKSFTDSASGPFIIDPLKLLFAVLSLRGLEVFFFWNRVRRVKKRRVRGMEENRR